MSWNGSGSYLPPATSFPEVNGTIIDAVRYNNTVNDLAGGITNCLAKDGQNAATGNVRFGGFKATGLAAGAVAGDALVFGQTGASVTDLTVTGAFTATGGVTGNADTATKLATARTINGVAFDGTANISVNTVAALTAGTGLVSTGGTFNGSTAVTFSVDSASANTASKIVTRDASGNFSANVITANLTGTASNATVATLAGQLTNSISPGAFLTGSVFNGLAPTTWAVDATTAATASKIVARDANGDSTVRAVNLANTLIAGKFSWYEEGTFTPVLAFGGASTGITYTTQVGKYTRIGNVVFYSVRIVLTSKGTATGSAQVSGLPYAANASPGIQIGHWGGDVAGGTTNRYTELLGAATTLSLVAGIGAGETDTAFVNDSGVSLQGSYIC